MVPSTITLRAIMCCHPPCTRVTLAGASGGSPARLRVH